VDALALLDERLAIDGLTMSTELFKAVHLAATKGLGTEDGPFKPHHEGEWRDGQAGVWDPIQGALVHAGSPQPEVEPRMEGLATWIQDAEERPLEWPPFVIAGVVHYNITDIHPFADGNGRTARLLTTAVLMRHGLVPGRLFNFDGHYGRNKDAYLAALRTVRQQTFNQEAWMRYFLVGLAQEYERVAAEVYALSQVGRTGRGERVHLTEAQQRGLTDLVIQNVTEFSRREYEKAAGVARRAAITDLTGLADAGVLERRGDGPSRRYRLVTAPANSWAGRGGGRPREWTDERIEAELRELIGTATTFPTLKDFEAAGKRALYNAIQRNGKSKRWAGKVGVNPPQRGRRTPTR
jgi:Fic family protein